MKCFHALAELIPEVILILDREGGIIYANPAIESVTGRQPDAVRGLTLFDLTHPDYASEARAFLGAALAGSDPVSNDLHWRHEDGRAVEMNIRASDCSGIPGIEGILISARDVSQQVRSESALQQVNRALRVLSAGNSELVQSADESTLLHAICRICVDLGGYRMAWVGYTQEDKARTVLPMAQAGFDDGYLDHIVITADEQPSGRGPTGTAIRTGEPQVSKNIVTDPRMEPWRENALGRGFQSSIALPLKWDSRAFGALMIYAAEPNAFESEELRLLTELADDLSFGLRALRTRAQHEAAQERLAYLAYFDELTGLPNQNRLFEELGRLSRNLQPGRQFGLLTLNLVSFGDIQAGIGVHHADVLLQQIAARVKTALRKDEMLTRVGGDEFSILIGERDFCDARECMQRVERALAEPFEQAGISISVQVRCGAAIAPDHGLEPEALILRSDIAQRKARRTGTSFLLYAGPTETESPRHLALITDLGAAIENDRLTVHYQPKLDLQTEKITGVEALVRWPHPERGMILPGEFIGIAEQTGLIKSLTYYVTEAVLRQCWEWRQEGLELPVAVNLSVKCFNDADLVSNLEELVQRWGGRPDLLQVEITESTLMEDPEKAHDILAQLGSKGIQIYVDDFGTGFSSLSYVASLPVHALKIDRSFVVSMLESPRTLSVIKATISLAHSLGIKTVAEGADAKEQIDALKTMGCSEVQGFYFCKPLESGALRKWIRTFSPG